MKRLPWPVTASAALLLFGFPPGATGAPPREPADYSVSPWGHVGDQVHRSTVDGHQFSYHLFPKVEGAGASHHLMLFVMDPKGRMASHGEVSCRVLGPDGVERQVTATAMTGGFGVDLDLTSPGSYEIRTRAVFGDRILADAFTYEMK